MDYLQSAKRFRDKAAERRRLAELAHTEDARQSNLRVAESYDALAGDVELLARMRVFEDNAETPRGSSDEGSPVPEVGGQEGL
jgi:hypothetical protein